MESVVALARDATDFGKLNGFKSRYDSFLGDESSAMKCFGFKKFAFK